jgi:hypothetical protein
VDFNDLVMLAQRYDTTLAANGAAAETAGATTTTSGSAMADWSQAMAVASGEVNDPTTVGGQTTPADGVEAKSGPPVRGVKAKAVKRAADMPVFPPAKGRVFSSKRVRREILA